jgi:hypothetical protein
LSSRKRGKSKNVLRMKESVRRKAEESMILKRGQEIVKKIKKSTDANLHLHFRFLWE